VLEKFQSIPLNQICMSSVTYGELFHGAMKSEQVTKNLANIMKLKTYIEVTH
jgi:predicted nucleic acid-binding protein